MSRRSSCSESAEVTDFAPVMILLTRRDEEAGGAELALRAQRNYPHRWTEVLSSARSTSRPRSG